MAKEEVRQVYPEFVEASGVHSDLEMKSYVMEGCSFSIRLGFNDPSGLADIGLSYLGDGGAVCAKAIKSKFKDEFGAAKIELTPGMKSHVNGEFIAAPVQYTSWDGPQLWLLVSEMAMPGGEQLLTIQYIRPDAVLPIN